MNTTHDKLAAGGAAKERPILFSGPMVWALLAGTKTQTRRVIKDQEIGKRFSHMTDDGRAHLEWLGTPSCGSGVWDVPEYSAQVASPYGKPGDRLWVRETHGFGGDAYAPDTFYRATSPDAPIQGRWLPSIHMRRIDSRILLEITEVRVERLQDISEADCVAEGMKPAQPDDDDTRHMYSPKWAYEVLWDQINGNGAWAANPWVWAVSFRVLSPTPSTKARTDALKGL